MEDERTQTIVAFRAFSRHPRRRSHDRTFGKDTDLQPPFSPDARQKMPGDLIGTHIYDWVADEDYPCKDKWSCVQAGKPTPGMPFA